VTPESLLDPTLQVLIQRHGATWAAVFAWLDGVTPLPPGDPGDGRPPSPAVSAFSLLQAAEDARRSGGHDAMVAARRRLNEEHPEVFRAYMERLESGTR
jgi:hypothetical protein